MSVSAIFEQIKSKFSTGGIIPTVNAYQESFKIGDYKGLTHYKKEGVVAYFANERACKYDGPKRFTEENIHELCAELEICCDETIQL